MKTVLIALALFGSAPAWAGPSGGKNMIPPDVQIPTTATPSVPPDHFYVVRVCPGTADKPAAILQNVTLPTEADFQAACAAAQK